MIVKLWSDTHARKILLGLIAAVIIASGFYVSVYAGGYSGKVFGRKSWYGYFDNNQQLNGGDVVLPPIEGIIALPSDRINSVESYVGLLKDYNANGNDHEKTGSAFIVNTMLGHDAPGNGRVVSEADWIDLTQRLNDRQANGKIDWGGFVNESINSYYQTDYNDVAYHVAAREEDGIVFLNDDNSIAYEILRRCANPMGRNTGGLPPAPPPKHYNLTPSVTSNPTGVVEPGATVTADANINNSGTRTSDPAPWQVSKFSLPSGSAIPVGSSDSTQDPAAYYGNGLISLGNDSGGLFGVGDTKPAGLISDSTSDQAVGSWVCYAVSVQKYSDNPVTDHWRHSTPACVKIGKKPKLQILGGDLMSGGDVSTSAANKNINGTSYTFGSWIEYGIFAIGTITGAGSGSAYAGSGLANAINCNVSLLSFTNAGSSTCSSTTTIGHYTSASSMPDVASSFSTVGAPAIGSGDLANQAKTGVFTSGNVILTGGTIQKGRWLVINAPTADITIDGNILYFPGVMQSISDIPQVVIIANNINITAKVTQVDAWLIAKGNLNTCSDVAGDLSANLCNQSLVVNGPVMAGKMYLRRTAGSGTGADHSGDPAEVFNLRPDAYLWASARATGSGRIQTVYTTELPPRL
jgi:hypothetical protein